MTKLEKKMVEQFLNVEARGGGVDESSDDCMKDESDDLDVDVFLKKNQKAENEQTRDGDDVGVARVAQLLNTLESDAFFGVADSAEIRIMKSRKLEKGRKFKFGRKPKAENNFRQPNFFFGFFGQNF
jgi:hypothetical protein